MPSSTAGTLNSRARPCLHRGIALEHAFDGRTVHAERSCDVAGSEPVLGEAADLAIDRGRRWRNRQR